MEWFIFREDGPVSGMSALPAGPAGFCGRRQAFCTRPMHHCFGGKRVESEVSRIRTDNTVVELVGTLDREAVPEARKHIRKMALGSMSRCFEIDLAQVSSLDTAGVALLVEVLQDLSERGRELRLRNLSQPVKEIIQLAGLDPFFVVGKPEDEK